MKNTCTICFLLFFILKISAQQKGLTFGISGGINQTSLTGATIDSLSNGGYQKSSIGQTIGITIDNKTSKFFGFKHELFYSRRLMTLKIDDGINPEFSSKFKRQYLDLFPVSASFYYKGFQVYAGPYLGILLNTSIQRKDADGNIYTDKSIYGTGEAPSNYSQKMDAGFIAGINYEFSNGINLGARFIRGFVPILENANTKQQWKIYNESFFITIGYVFY
jgi:hypothetical protein